MPIELTIPLEKEFKLERSDKHFGIPKAEATKVTVAQGTQRAHERRGSLFSEFIQEMDNSNASAETIRNIQRFSFEELKRIETYLSLRACNILGSNGEPLFKFDANGKITEHDFNTAWWTLPPNVAEEIHEKVLLVNPDWRPDRGE